MAFFDNCGVSAVIVKELVKHFGDKQVRMVWNDDQEEWLFSVIDVINILTDSNTPRRYWNDLKTKLVSEGSEVSENIGQLKLIAQDGQLHKT
jgi:hypothetical protein